MKIVLTKTKHYDKIIAVLNTYTHIHISKYTYLYTHNNTRGLKCERITSNRQQSRHSSTAKH